MTSAEFLVDAFTRVRQSVREVVDGVTADQLLERPEERGNSIAWLLWHLSRVQDDHLADAAGSEQLWTSGGWIERFGLPFDASATGYGQSAEQSAAVQVDSGDLLVSYYEAVHDRTVSWVTALDESEFDRVIDRRWNPPVTLGARLVSVIADDLKHVGQAAYIKGLVTGWA